MTESNKQITLDELVIFATDFLEKQGQIKTQEDREELERMTNEYGERFVIRTYIPMMEKMKVMMAVVFNMQNVDIETQEVRSLALEKNLFFNVLLGLYAGVDVNNLELQTYASYDLLYPIFANFILQFCASDYSKFVDLVDRTLNLYNVQEFMELGEKIDFDAMQKMADANRKLMEDLKKSKELVKELKEVFVNTHPANARIAEDIQRLANEEATKALDERKAIKKGKKKNA